MKIEDPEKEVELPKIDSTHFKTWPKIDSKKELKNKFKMDYKFEYENFLMLDLNILTDGKHIS